MSGHKLRPDEIWGKNVKKSVFSDLRAIFGIDAVDLSLELG